MTDRTIEKVSGIIGGDDWFSIGYSRRSTLKLDYFLNQFNFDEYYCVKSSNHQRFVTYEELLEFKHCKYIFFKKDVYSKDHITIWIEWMHKIMFHIPFVNIPFPPFHPNKIIIK